MNLNEVDGSRNDFSSDKKQPRHPENAQLGHFFLLVKCKEEYLIIISNSGSYCLGKVIHYIYFF